MHDMLKYSMVEIVKLRGFQDGVYYHGRILNAVKNKDTDAAAELMRDHIKTAISDVTMNSESTG